MLPSPPLSLGSSAKPSSPSSSSTLPLPPPSLSTPASSSALTTLLAAAECTPTRGPPAKGLIASSVCWYFLLPRGSSATETQASARGQWSKRPVIGPVLGQWTVTKGGSSPSLSPFLSSSSGKTTSARKRL